MSIAVMRQALEALENHTAIKHPQQRSYRDAAIDALRQAIEQAEQAQPVAWISHSDSLLSWDKFYDHMEPLYTAPPQRQWVGLTDEEIDLLEELYAPPVHPDFVNDADHCTELIRHVEAKIKEKNT